MIRRTRPIQLESWATDEWAMSFECHYRCCRRQCKYRDLRCNHSYLVRVCIVAVDKTSKPIPPTYPGSIISAATDNLFDVVYAWSDWNGLYGLLALLASGLARSVDQYVKINDNANTLSTALHKFFGVVDFLPEEGLSWKEESIYLLQRK